MKKGISLIVLIVTIIVMIIIAGAVIISLSNSNIIDQADKAKTKWDIANIKEQLTIHNALVKTGTNTEIKNGTLKDIGIDDESWNEKVIIQDGKLVFLPENLTDSEEEALQNAGLERSEHISVVNASTKANKYANDDSVVTPETLYDNLKGTEEDIVYILEDLTTWPESTEEFYGTMDGLGHTVVASEEGITVVNYGTIRGVTSIGEQKEYFTGGIAVANFGTIEYCNNTVNAEGDSIGGIVRDNAGIIYRCTNRGNLTTTSDSYDAYIGGIASSNEGNGDEEIGRIVECVNYGKIGAWDENGNVITGIRTKRIGGIVGSEWGRTSVDGVPDIYNCYNVGDVAGYDDLAGISGDIDVLLNRNLIIQNCYNIGNVFAESSNDGAALLEINGLRNTTKIRNCFSKNISDLDLLKIHPNSSNLTTTNVDWINNLVSDGEIETEADRDKLLEMLNAGNTEEVWVKDTNNINNGYPILKWQLDK